MANPKWTPNPVEWTLFSGVSKGAAPVRWRSTQRFLSKSKLVKAMNSLGFAKKSTRITKVGHKYTAVGADK